ncbi:hypothetical protein CBER1_10331 [Cercospora berteroae]|uniref:Uncharacterized protein n=1 Tax=Cercospora berteroae TaxID=357750 RepID=A0A2S6CHP3_9PEZI|nr:hypothetical protein CBER1_10331 [Cercospora berteroae]
MTPFLQELSKRKMSADDVECLESTLALTDTNRADEDVTTAHQAKRRSTVTNRATNQHHNINLRPWTDNTLNGFREWPEEVDNHRDRDFNTAALGETSESELVSSYTEDHDGTECMDSNNGGSQPESQGGSTLVEDEELNPFSYEDMIPDMSHDRQTYVDDMKNDDSLHIGKGDEAYQVLKKATSRQQWFNLFGYVSPTMERMSWIAEAFDDDKDEREIIIHITDWGLPLLRVNHDRQYVFTGRKNSPLRMYFSRLFEGKTSVDKFTECLQGRGETRLGRRDLKNGAIKIDGIRYRTTELFVDPRVDITITTVTELWRPP